MAATTESFKITTEDMLAMPLWRLAELALKDLQWAEKQKGLVINMGHWATPMFDGEKCAVCLAGSVMAKEHKRLKSSEWTHQESKLGWVINDLRIGSVSGALNGLGRDGEEGCDLDCEITDYDSCRVAFKHEFRELIARLKEANL